MADLARVKFWRRWRRDDLTVAALGITLGLICALFPWYIFLNPDKFGPPAVTFDSGGTTTGTPRAGLNAGGQLGTTIAKGDPLEDFAPETLDLLATGTTPASEAAMPEPAPDQPFPVETVSFQVVHIANGRAMIEDDTGLYVVGAGDRLPDNSRVARIEQRNGAWVVVTSADQVLTVR